MNQLEGEERDAFQRDIQDLADEIRDLADEAAQRRDAEQEELRNRLRDFGLTDQQIENLLNAPSADVARLAHASNDAKDKVRFCERCFNVAEGALCPICADDRRDATVVCVVEESRDIVALERTGEFRGRYHVLLGAMNPLEGIGPEQLKIRELLTRIDAEGITEVILCTNPKTEGEVTAMYLARQLQPLGLTVTRIASGLPVGGDLEYADELTLGRALEGRRPVDDG